MNRVVRLEEGYTVLCVPACMVRRSGEMSQICRAPL